MEGLTSKHVQVARWLIQAIDMLEQEWLEHIEGDPMTPLDFLEQFAGELPLAFELSKRPQIIALLFASVALRLLTQGRTFQTAHEVVETLAREARAEVQSGAARVAARVKA